MPTPMAAEAVLNREFLEIRAKLLEIAASLDRIDRGGGSVEGDSRMDLILEGLSLLREDGVARAEAIQLLFSRQYDENWREQYKLAPRKA
ncbi:MAG TPA: hypothetical protein VML55_19575 [Planctomycetaceae bacterium]|nr:hypothetical protein [Planctomycetaceae bacterium]